MGIRLDLSRLARHREQIDCQIREEYACLVPDSVRLQAPERQKLALKEQMHAWRQSAASAVLQSEKPSTPIIS